MKMKCYLSFCLIYSIIWTLYSCQLSNSTVSVVVKLQETLPNAIITEIEPTQDFYQTAFEIQLPQPLDHLQPTQDSFSQLIHLSFVDFNAPVVVETEGYSLYHFQQHKPLSSLLKANQIIIEHRYLGQSKPDSLNWDYLNTKQAAADHHRIIELLKPFFKTKKWISSGFSKGGQTALFHRRHYPDDVLATVAFNSPIPLAQQDKRLYDFFDTIDSDECRQKIMDYQRLVLQKQEDLLPLFEQYAQKEKITFKQSSLAIGLEYGVLEYPFSFWQYHHIDCNNIPTAQDSLQIILDHLTKVVGFGWLSDKAFGDPTMYQFHTELGYYGYVTKNVKDLLQHAPFDANNLQFAPNANEISFDSTISKDLKQWLVEKGERILYIYGSNDPWAAAGLQQTNANCIIYTLPFGNHATFIEDFPTNEQQEIITLLNQWLDE